ncbi:MAG: transposase [Acidobacteria bacterium]|nr:transposase [Acidobacteriota bacterium]
MAQTSLSAHNGLESLAAGADAVSELSPKLRITRRRLPHWTLEGATYYITFRLFREPLTLEEIRFVRDHIVSGDPRYYELLAAAVLPDHVHLLLRPATRMSLSLVMKGIKGVTARELNRRRRRKGPIWQDESYDRIVRNQSELIEKLNYMLLNSVKAGLTDNPWTYVGWYFKGKKE